jgi:AcrR family transcriptional regulator
VAPPPTTRQQRTERQGATVDALLSAAAEVLNHTGYDDLTLRAVATAAGVTHTTAYAYFSSKAHLVAEMFWRRLQALGEPKVDDSLGLAGRITAAMSGPSLLLADEPVLARAALPALLAADPDVDALRTAVGALLTDRITAALGSEADPAVIEVVLLVFSGAMVQAGMGYFDYDGVVRRVARAATLMDH